MSRAPSSISGASSSHTLPRQPSPLHLQQFTPAHTTSADLSLGVTPPSSSGDNGGSAVTGGLPFTSQRAPAQQYADAAADTRHSFSALLSTPEHAYRSAPLPYGVVDSALVKQKDHHQQQQQSATPHSSRDSTAAAVNARLRAAQESLGTPTAAIAAAADAARQRYCEKLRDSVDSIATALAQELPRDHLLLQLLADGSTEAYCKVRLGEIVEGFLYSSQSEQYHHLISVLAEKELDVVTLRQQLDDAARQAESYARDAATTAAAAAAYPRGGENPMAEEAARQELMAILEATSREHELDRCRRALAAPLQLAEIAHREVNDAQRFDYVADVMRELYHTAHAFLRYADGSLDSLESLRNELAAPHAGAAKLGDTALASGSAAPALVRSAASTPMHKRAGGSAADSPASPQQLSWGPAAGTKVAERATVRELEDRLRDAQLLSSRALDRLAQQAQQQRLEVERLQRALAEASANSAAVSSAAAAQSAASQAEMAAQRQEHQDALVRLRSEDERALVELREQLRGARQEVFECQQNLAAAAADADELRVQLKRAQLDGSQLESDANTTATALTNELHLCRVDLRACEAEVLCSRVEVCISTLETLFFESEAAKHDLLARSGYDISARVLLATARTQHEELRHVRAQKQLAASASLERQVAERACMEELGSLLRTLWEDDTVAAALQSVAEATSSHAALAISVGSARDGAEAAHAEGAEALDQPSVAPTPTSRARAAADHRDTITAESSPGAASPPAPEPTPWKDAQDAHRLPTTLQGLATALAYAYRALRGRTQHCHQTVERQRAALAQRATRIRALETTTAQLRAALQREQEQSQRWQQELEVVNDAEPMRELLTRQDALLKAVSEERNALRKQWTALNTDYVTLERRNGQLHERCAEKEHENATLSGLLKSYRSPALASPDVKADNHRSRDPSPAASTL